jgi:hypothetical protein
MFFALSAAGDVYSDEITSYKQGWYDGYRKGMRDAFVDFSKNIEDYKLLIEAVFDYKKILAAGGDNLFAIQTEYERVVTDNGIEFKRNIKVIPFTPGTDIVFLDLIKNRFDEVFERVAVTSGWWVFSDVSSLAREDIGLLEFIAEQNGMRPRRFNEFLVFSIEDRPAQARKVQQILEVYKIKTEVSHVEIR